MQMRESGESSHTNEGRVEHGDVIEMVGLTLHQGFQQEKTGRHRE